MGAKITLTGVRSSRLRKTAKYYAFEMTLGGSPTAPKGLPLPSSSVQYTVFVSLKAGKKAGLEGSPIEQKWLIQGEIVLDIPVDECPGEIGVVAYQISALPASGKENQVKSQDPIQEPIAAKAEVAATVEAVDKVSTDDVRMVPIGDIHLPEKFQGAWLNPKKTEPVREWIQKNGRLDKPLDVCITDGAYWLVDGYRRYVVAQEIGFTEVPVRIVDASENR